MTPTYGYVPEALDETKVAPHLVRDHVPSAVAPARKMWKSGQMLNQKSTPACSGFSMTAELIAAPETDLDLPPNTGNQYALNHYHRAQVIYYGPAAYPQNKDRTGASIQASAKVALERGLITEYLWAHTISEVRDAILTTGPVVIGIPWFDSMLKTRDDGYCRVTIPATRPADLGYHAVCLTGYDPDAPITVRGRRGPLAAYRVRNSWGHMWGSLAADNWRHTTGDGWILEDDLERLFAYDGEAWTDKACLIVGRNPVDLAALLAAHPDPTVS